MRNRKTMKAVACAAAACTAIVLAAVVLVAVFPRGTSSRYADSETYGGTEYDATSGAHNHTGWTNLNSVVTEGGTYSIGASGSYYLSADLTALISITFGVTVNLCLNGHVLRGRSSNSDVILMGSSNMTYDTVLNLYDCGGDMEKHYYKLRSDGVSYDFSDTTLTESTADGYVRGGLITGGSVNTSGRGGAISLMDGVTLNMYGGTIAGNTSGASGAVCVAGGTFNMYGGSISGNYNSSTASNTNYGGGGVNVETYTYADSIALDGYFYMHDGEIRNNYCAGYGGGVEVNCGGTVKGATFVMYGGTIAGNHAKYGGGVCLYDTGAFDGYGDSSYNPEPAVFEMSGGSIRDNVAESGGGGVYMETKNVRFEMSGGVITGNVQTNASSNKGAGGVDYEYDDTVALSGTAYVYGNFCAGGKSNIGIVSGHYITLSGALAEGAMIGLTLYGHTQITSSASYASQSVGCFVSDDDNYGVQVNSSSSYLELYAKSS